MSQCHLPQSYYAVINYIRIVPSEFNLPNLGSDIYIVTFTDADISNPKYDIIYMYYHNGTRHFLWNDKTWLEYNLSFSHTVKMIEKKLKAICDKNNRNKLFQMYSALKKYAHTSPSFNKISHRVLYHI